ncbi:MAG: TolB family protein, partial [Gemmatimonadaceae bacterium]
YDSPRFLRDGRVLLWRDTPRGDGSLAADLYVWDPSRRTVRRVTHGASVHDADPTPDGRSAVATRCRAGWCDVVLVDLASGAVRTLLAGSPTVTYYRPRVSPDGARFVVAVNAGGKWELRVARVSGESSLVTSGDGTANWYDAAWRDDQTLIAVGDRGGVPNLYTRQLAGPDSAWRRLTGVTGAAVAPAVDRRVGSIWFLSLYSHGYDLRQIDATASAPPLALSPTFAPVVPYPSALAARLDSDAVSPPRPFGFGARSLRWLPLPEADADGVSAALGMVSMDLIGRTRILAQGAFGDPAAWRGGSLAVDWRGSRPGLEVRAFDAAQRPSASRTPVPGASLLDARMSGGEIALDDDWSFDTWAARARLGGSVGRTRALVGSASAADRSLAFGALSAGWVQHG